jgi:hypothetical protein
MVRGAAVWRSSAMASLSFTEGTHAAPIVGDARVAVEQSFFLEHARSVAREHPEHLAALGMSAEEYARSMTGPSMTIDESVAAGWMSAAEGRFILGQSALEDLLELGHSPGEARAILLDQQERACAST